MQNFRTNWRLDLFNSSFLSEWFRAPLCVGAIAPSSAFLAKAMTRGVSEHDYLVIELGPGTGVFTAALLKNGIAANKIAVIERGKTFAENLKVKLPSVTVIEDDAAKIDILSPFETGTVKTVICGLPLLSMPDFKVQQIIEASFNCLTDDGEFRLFTYGHRCPINKATLDYLELDSKREQTVLFNLPPASVFTIKRRKS